MESKVAKLGRSLLVPCVQEMAKEPLTKVPKRYVRTDEDPPILSDTDSLPQIPVLDMQKMISDQLKDFGLQELHHACKEWGFFQLINNGVSSALVEKVKLEIKEFFNLPMEKKKKFWRKPDEMEGFGLAFVVSEEQKLNWGDLFFMITLPSHLRKPLIPQAPSLPQRNIGEMRNLAIIILELMGKALGMDRNDMNTLFEDGLQMMRMNY